MQRLRNNQQWASKIRSTQIPKHLAFFGLGILSWLGFSYLFILFVKIGQSRSRSIYNFPWHDDAPVWTFKYCLAGAIVIIFTKWTFGLLTEKSKSLFRDFLILIFLIPLDSFVITAFFNFVLGVGYTGGEASKDYDFVMGFLSSFITQTFVAMTCIGYFYLNLINKTKEKLRQAQQAKTAMELKTLQQNIEPHFLFNNLNVLSSLIEKNPQTANEFLNKLAELYRYILKTQNAEVVSVRDELDFARNYTQLIEQRFGAAYNFDWTVPTAKINGQMIVPAALQGLLENAVKHNAGNQKEPLQIRIELNEKFLLVENALRPKSQTRPTSGSGLRNLTARYEFLTEQPVEIARGENVFKVKLPLLRL